MLPIDHRYVASVGLIALAVATRLLPHQANFTAVGAVTLVAASYLGWRWGVAVAFGAMAVSDFVIGGYELPVMLAVYGSFAAVAWLGTFVNRGGRVRWERVALSSFGGSTLFYLVTNYAVWQFTSLYPKTASGLLASYLAAVPFYRNSLLGDAVFSGLLFGAIELARYRVIAWRSARVPTIVR